MNSLSAQFEYPHQFLVDLATLLRKENARNPHTKPLTADQIRPMGLEEYVAAIQELSIEEIIPKSYLGPGYAQRIAKAFPSGSRVCLAALGVSGQGNIFDEQKVERGDHISVLEMRADKSSIGFFTDDRDVRRFVIPYLPHEIQEHCSFHVPYYMFLNQPTLLQVEQLKTDVMRAINNLKFFVERPEYKDGLKLILKPNSDFEGGGGMGV